MITCTVLDREVIARAVKVALVAGSILNLINQGGKFVSLSFDEAHAYLEGDDTVYAVDIPPELYRWTESFVLTHYCPQQMKKRKRRDWVDRAAERSHQ